MRNSICITSAAAIVAVLFMCSLTAKAGSLPELNAKYQSATAKTDGESLTVSTGKVTRTWKWTGKGFGTTSVTAADDKVFAVAAPTRQADWDLGEFGKGEGKLVSLKAFEDDDEHFTSKHLAVEAEIHYATLDVKYVIWAYPGAPGLRTQLWLKLPDGEDVKPGETFGSGVSETLNMNVVAGTATAFGYKAGLKAHTRPYDILRTASVPAGGSVDWASGLILDTGGAGVVLVKESDLHTGVGKHAVETGAFVRDGNKVRVTGLGMVPGDLKTDRYRFGWANWMILYTGGNLDAQLAIKQFDRDRYPVHPDRDVFIMANTWGTEDRHEQCAYKAREENVLRELDACADIGIDILQIDDGWQDKKTWLPQAEYKAKAPFELHDGTKISGPYRVYPDGFGRVRARAKELGVRLGLWNAYYAPTKAIETNYDDGDFKSFKLDFANLNTKDKFDELYYKAREIIKHSKYTAVVNWDVTETSPRMGFYFGRDCGNLYLTNRKAFTVRDSVRYDPWQILRDGWELARYMNLNKLQLTFQNKDLTPPDAKTRTDALKSTHAYDLAVTLMSSPIFFTETQFLSPAARDEIRPIIKAYKAERPRMYQGYVFALGDKPNNASWTGFQNHNPDGGAGYLTIFRERKNTEKSAKIALHFFKPGAKLTLTDVLTGKASEVTLDDKGRAEFEIDKAPGFLFLKYGG